MADAQAFDIPLESPLEVITSRGIVNASRPSFSYNTQQQVGDLMTNSAKYEGNGCFTDEYHHQLTLTIDKLIESDFYNPADCLPLFSDFNTPRASESLTVAGENNAYQFSISFIQSITASIGTATFSRAGDSPIQITGTTRAGQSWSVGVDPYSLEVLSSTLPADYVASTTRTGAYAFDLSVKSSLTGLADIQLPYVSSDKLAVQLNGYDSNTSTDKYMLTQNAQQYLELNRDGTHLQVSPACNATATSTRLADGRDQIDIVSSWLNVLDLKANAQEFITGIASYGATTVLDRLAPMTTKNEDSLRVWYGIYQGPTYKVSRANCDFIDYFQVQRTLRNLYLADIQLVRMSLAIGYRDSEFKFAAPSKAVLDTYKHYWIDNQAGYHPTTEADGNMHLVASGTKAYIATGGGQIATASVPENQYNQLIQGIRQPYTSYNATVGWLNTTGKILLLVDGTYIHLWRTVSDQTAAAPQFIQETEPDGTGVPNGQRWLKPSTGVIYTYGGITTGWYQTSTYTITNTDLGEYVVNWTITSTADTALENQKQYLFIPFVDQQDGVKKWTEFLFYSYWEWTGTRHFRRSEHIVQMSATRALVTQVPTQLTTSLPSTSPTAQQMTHEYNVYYQYAMYFTNAADSIFVSSPAVGFENTQSLLGSIAFQYTRNNPYRSQVGAVQVYGYTIPGHDEPNPNDPSNPIWVPAQTVKSWRRLQDIADLYYWYEQTLEYGLPGYRTVRIRHRGIVSGRQFNIANQELSQPNIEIAQELFIRGNSLNTGGEIVGVVTSTFTNLGQMGPDNLEEGSNVDAMSWHWMLELQLANVACRTWFKVHINNFHLKDYQIYDQDETGHLQTAYFPAGFHMGSRMFYMTDEILTQLAANLDMDGLASYAWINGAFSGQITEAKILKYFNPESYYSFASIDPAKPVGTNGGLITSPGPEVRTVSEVNYLDPFDPPSARPDPCTQDLTLKWGDVTVTLHCALSKSAPRLTQITGIDVDAGTTIILQSFTASWVTQTSPNGTDVYTFLRISFKDDTSYRFYLQQCKILQLTGIISGSTYQSCLMVAAGFDIRLTGDLRFIVNNLNGTLTSNLYSLLTSTVGNATIGGQNYQKVFRAEVESTDVAQCSVVFPGAYDRATTDWKWISTQTTQQFVKVIFEYDGEQYYIQINYDGTQSAQIVSKNILDNTVVVNQLADFFSEAFIEGHHELDDYMFIQQYAIDKNHILGLKDNNEYYLMERVYKSDVEGDLWQVKDRLLSPFERTDLVKVSSAYDTLPYLFKVDIGEENCEITFAQLSTTTLQLQWKHVNVPITVYQHTTSTSGIYLYNESFRLKKDSKITSTVINGKFMIGIKASKLLGFTIVISNDALETVINGYYCVGISGLLTGLSIPKYAVSVQQGITRIDGYQNGLVWTQYCDDLVYAIDYPGNALLTIPLYTSYEHIEKRPDGFWDEAIGGTFAASNFAFKLETIGDGQSIIPRPRMETMFYYGAYCWAYAFWSASGWHCDSTIDGIIERIACSGMRYISGVDDALFNVAKMLCAGLVAGINDKYDGVTNRDQQGKVLEDMGVSQSFSAFAQAEIVKQNSKNELVTGSFQDPNNLVCVASVSRHRSQVYCLTDQAKNYAGPGYVQLQAQYVAEIEADSEYKAMFQCFGVAIRSAMPDVDIPIPIPFDGSFQLPLSQEASFELVGVVGEPPFGYSAGTNAIKYSRFNGKHITFSYPIKEQTASSLQLTKLDLKLVETDIKIPKPGGWGGGSGTTGWVPVPGVNVTYPDPYFVTNGALVQGVAKVYVPDLGTATTYGSNQNRSREEFVNTAATGNLVVDMLQRTGLLPIADDNNLFTEQVSSFGDTMNGLQYADAGLMDYCIDKTHELYFVAIGDDIVSVATRDTKILDGEPNNVVFNGGYTTIGAPYVSLRYSKYMGKQIFKPIQADCVKLNSTGINVMKGLRLYHGFDGVFFRMRAMIGSDVTADSEVQHSLYAVHDYASDFKVGNMAPPTSFFGFGLRYPSLSDLYKSSERIYAKTFENIHEAPVNLQGYRYSLPIVNKTVTYMPHASKLYSVYASHVIDGVTSLTTENRTNSPLLAQVTPTYKDFVIYGKAFRANKEYISRIVTERGIVYFAQIAPKLGLKYVGSTTKTAWFFNPVIRHFFVFTGTNSTQAADVAVELQDHGLAARVRDAYESTYDFISQESLIFTDFEERISIIRCSEQFLGMIYKWNKTIALENNQQYQYSTAGGLVIAGRKRFQVNRFLLTDLMKDDLDANRKHWTPIPGDNIEEFWQERDYGWEYDKIPLTTAVRGYYHEPFKLATSFLGIDDNTDCQFEWELQFGVNDLLRELMGDKVVKVNLAAETIGLGGVKKSPVTHIYLKNDMFTRSPYLGFYSCRFQSLNGAGTGEKLYIWSDGLVGLRSLRMLALPITAGRTSPLVTRVDISGLEEF